eukprot:Gb_33384 [translate_table: standard]
MKEGDRETGAVLKKKVVEDPEIGEGGYLKLEKNQLKQKEQSSRLEVVHLEENKSGSVANQSQVHVLGSYKDDCEHNFEDYSDLLEPYSPLDALHSNDNACSNLPEDMDDKSFLRPDSHVEESTLKDFTLVYSSATTKKLHTDMVGRGSNFPIEGQVTLTSTEKIQEFRYSTLLVGRKSRPISPYACRTGDGIDKIQEIHLEASTTKNLHTYAHPIPIGGRSTSVTGCVNNSAINMKLSGAENSISGPLMRQSYISKGQSVSEESTTRTRARPMPLPSSVGKVPLLRLDAPVVYDSKRIKRHAHSGPLISKSCARKSFVCNSSSLPSLQVEPSSKSRPISRCPKSSTYVSPKTSPSLSSHHLSPPRVSELHKLPRPLDKSGVKFINKLAPAFLVPVLLSPVCIFIVLMFGVVATFQGTGLLFMMPLRAMCETMYRPEYHSKQGLVAACEACLPMGKLARKTIPYRATIYGQLVQSAFLWTLHDLHGSETHILDGLFLTPVESEEALSSKPLQHAMHCNTFSSQVHVLLEPFKVFDFDFWRRPDDHGDMKVQIKITAEGKAQAVVL